MKVFFDNNVPAPLRRNMPRHQVSTARQMGWASVVNGDLLREVEAGGFDVMVTGDKNIRYQQNLAGRRVSLVVVGTIDWTVLRHHTAPVAAVDRATPGSFEELPDPTPPKPKPPRRPGGPKP